MNYHPHVNRLDRSSSSSSAMSFASRWWSSANINLTGSWIKFLSSFIELSKLILDDWIGKAISITNAIVFCALTFRLRTSINFDMKTDFPGQLRWEFDFLLHSVTICRMHQSDVINFPAEKSGCCAYPPTPSSRLIKSEVQRELIARVEAGLWRFKDCQQKREQTSKKDILSSSCTWKWNLIGDCDVRHRFTHHRYDVRWWCSENEKKFPTHWS